MCIHVLCVLYIGLLVEKTAHKLHIHVDSVALKYLPGHNIVYSLNTLMRVFSLGRFAACIYICMKIYRHRAPQNMEKENLEKEK